MNPKYVIRREDTTFEIEFNGLPYHVTEDDSLYVKLQAVFAELSFDKAAVYKEAANNINSEDSLFDEAQSALRLDFYDLVENHKGAWGWLNGEEVMIEEFGSLPEGWSEEPPVAVQYARELEVLQKKYEAPYNGVQGGLLPMKLMEVQTAVALGVGIEGARGEYAALLDAYRDEATALEERYV